MRRPFRLFAAALPAVLILVACSGAADTGSEPAPTQAGAEVPAGSTSPTGAPGAVDEAGDTWEPLASGAVLLLNEIGFRPPDGVSSFVEVLNAGSDPVDPSGMALVDAAGTEFRFPAGLSAVEPGNVLMIRFGRSGEITGPVVDGSPAGFAAAEVGSLTLNDRGGSRLDHVSWGGAEPGSVPLGRGGVLPDPAPNSAIGRAPGDASVSSSAWSFYSPEEATPGSHNRRPAVGLMLPIDGAEVTGPARLGWYPVAGAGAYLVEIASDPGFALLMDSATVAYPGYEAALEPGAYYWRVQAIGPDGSPAGYSGTSRITITAGFDAQAMKALRSAGPITAAPASRRQAAAASLGVPLIAQHKDTAMLELQSTMESGAHAWDTDHGTLDPGDPSDNMNCVLASAIMVNRFFGGSLSQDRLGYEILQPLAAGPETDLNYGRGFYPVEIGAALSYALGGSAAGWRSNGDTEGIWRTVTGEIDTGRPVVAFFTHAAGGHVVVVSGYQQRADGGRFLEISDPWGPVRYVVPLGAGAQSELDGGTAASLDYYFVLPGAPAPAGDEPGISTDTDGDGIVDFDEANRFGTNPGSPDTDGDGVGDYQEVAATVFDPTHGAAATRSFAARDLDGDGDAMETDEDSDEGGCSDGLEDSDRDGEYVAGSETYNFDPADDACYRLEAALHSSDGPLTFTFSYSGSFVVQADGSLLGSGTGLAVGHDTAAPCIDVDAGQTLEITSHTEGPFTFDIAGSYRAGGAPAGRLPLADDPDPEFELLFPIAAESFSTTVSECELEDDALFTELLKGFVGNLGWFIGSYEGEVVAPAEGEIPPYPVASLLLPAHGGELTMSIERVGPEGG